MIVQMCRPFSCNVLLGPAYEGQNCNKTSEQSVLCIRTPSKRGRVYLLQCCNVSREARVTITVQIGYIEGPKCHFI